MRNLITKEARLAARWIPKHTMAVRRPNIDAVFYVDTTKLTCVAYVGTAAHPFINERYLSIKDMEARIRRLFDNLESHAESKAQRKENQQKPHTLKVGNILRTSWGYDQTNVEFFQVTKVVSNSTVEIREIAQERTEDGYMCGTCTPIPGKFLDRAETLRKRASADNSVRIDQSRHAWLWEGKPAHYSSYA